MGFGGSIFLIAVGAILVFAVKAEVSYVDLRIIGWILIAAGGIWLLLSTWAWWGRNRPPDRPARRYTDPDDGYRPPPRSAPDPRYAKPRRDGGPDEPY